MEAREGHGGVIAPCRRKKLQPLGHSTDIDVRTATSNKIAGKRRECNEAAITVRRRLIARKVSWNQAIVFRNKTRCTVRTSQAIMAVDLLTGNSWSWSQEIGGQ